MVEERKNKIFYFQTDGLENRNKIADMLKLFNFKYLDMTGGQAAFKPKGKFSYFKRLIDIYADIHGIKVYLIKYCLDPGLGLCFPPEFFYKPEPNLTITFE